ncbi:MAG: DivIVA domain-containing protein [Clostridiales bacterium]|jgi:cell division septum initiation protein DivIVA|nr:DivIVA domain-containing protein [Clostridiales bacterium]MDR2749079.1 DivIVA domain-containing protein [Clostridiales bacterium]
MDGGISFTERPMGYDKQQVDSYIAKVTYEYQSMHSEYTKLVSKCNSLSEACIKVSEERNRAIDSLNQQKASAASITADAETIARAIVDAELLAKQIVDRANEEAATVQESVKIAREELKRIQGWKDKAQMEFTDFKRKISTLLPE